MAIMGVYAYIRYFKHLTRHTKEAYIVADYLDSVYTYHRFALRGGENIKNADQMLCKISDKLQRAVREILGLTANGKTAFLESIIKHCLDSHNAAEKPRKCDA